MTAKDSFLNSEAFKDLSEDKKQLITGFLKSDKPSVNDILLLISKINSGTPLTQNQQKRLIEALSENLTQDGKKTISNIIKIIKAMT